VHFQLLAATAIVPPPAAEVGDPQSTNDKDPRPGYVSLNVTFVRAADEGELFIDEVSVWSFHRDIDA
jgi:hypothetical protein